MNSKSYSNKSYVTVEQHVCIICGKTFDTGNILMDKCLRERFKENTTTGYSLCPEHKDLYEKGFLALVETISEPECTGLLKPEKAQRTGRICHIKREVFDQIVNKKIDPKYEFIFVDTEMIDKIQSMVSPK